MAGAAKISPVRISIEAYRLLFQNRTMIAGLGAWPLGISVLGSLFYGVVTGTVGGGLLIVFQVLLLFFVAVPFATACHRIFFHCPARPPAGSLTYRFRPQEFRYLGYRAMLLILFVLGSMIIAPIVMALAGIDAPDAMSGGTAGGGTGPGIAITGTLSPDFLLAMVLSLVPLGAVFCRLALVFPAVSINRTFSLGEAWRLGDGNTVRILLTYVVALFPLAFVHVSYLGLVESLAPNFSWSLTRVVFVLIAMGVLSLFEDAIMVAINALIYRALVLGDTASRGSHVDFEAD